MDAVERTIEIQELCLRKLETTIVAEHPSLAKVLVMAPLLSPELGCISFKLSTC